MSKLREWRKSKRMTQERLATRLSTTGATISRVEAGEQWPSPALLSSIERVTKGAVVAADILADYTAVQRARAKLIQAAE